MIEALQKCPEDYYITIDDVVVERIVLEEERDLLTPEESDGVVALYT